MKEVRPKAGRLDFDSLLEGVIQQESGGRAGAVGPQTSYGQPLGMTQMLPETAREMAGTLGVPFREELLRGTSPEAAAYQKKLGAAYLREGLNRHGGDVRKGLMYYHGGPNQKLWGPKTRGYADAIIRRLGGR